MTQKNKKKLRNSSMLKTTALAPRDLPKKEDRRTGLLLFPRKLTETSKCVQRTALRQKHSTPWGPITAWQREQGIQKHSTFTFLPRVW